MAKHDIREINRQEYDKWNEFVENSPEGTIFHRTDWLEIFGGFFIIGYYNQNNEIIAGMPCYHRYKKIINPPLTPYQGIIIRKIEGKLVNQTSIRKKITKEILEFLSEKYKNVSINVPPAVSDVQSYIWLGFISSVRYTYILKIASLAEVENSLEKEMRTCIKKAINDGLSVKETEDFDLFFRLVKKTYRRQEKKASFETIANEMNRVMTKKNMRKILITLKDEKPIAGVYIIFDSKRSYYILGGYDSEDSHYGASALALMTAIKYTKEKLGLNEFDFEGSMVPRIERFFRQFGGELVPYYKLEKITFHHKIFDKTKRLLKTVLFKK